MTAQQFRLFGGMFILVVIATGVASQNTRSFTIVNNCKETIWPGITHGDGFNGSGFALKPGQTAVYTASSNWNGRIWGRTGCNFDKDGNGTCQTGGCSKSLNCTVPGSPPATIADFTLGSPDYYDVSLVDGFNLPIVITPLKGKENCSNAGCDGDLRKNCPQELALKSSGGDVIACRSACEVFSTDEYCCRGTYAIPETCHATNYSRAFKSVCPVAYSYAYDDPTSVKTCSGADYVVSFCASRNGTVCSFHDSSLACGGSTGFRTAIPGWLVILIISLSLVLRTK
ncbi:hypothetical protein MLD38_022879 [Melastoma candidum]|uniref:Uncharacterized protein n=1 Tax=Melastoma candidum TaxID=119954 RepID=A0ACB9QMJ7_9MYRT|nr:hypothetical protein MLD38_022879 [Melastoma candidum]